jgi:hypothetical protein
MTDTVIAETASTPPVPEAIPPEAAAPAETPLPPEADASALLEIEYPIGPVRQGALDHLLARAG